MRGAMEKTKRYSEGHKTVNRTREVKGDFMSEESQRSEKKFMSTKRGQQWPASNQMVDSCVTNMTVSKLDKIITFLQTISNSL